jgi:hypothetical protein
MAWKDDRERGGFSFCILKLFKGFKAFNLIIPVITPAA